MQGDSKRLRKSKSSQKLLCKISPKLQFKKKSVNAQWTLKVKETERVSLYFEKKVFLTPLSYLSPDSPFISLPRDTLFIYWLSKSMTEHLEYTNQNRKWADKLCFFYPLFLYFISISFNKIKESLKEKINQEY